MTFLHPELTESFVFYCGCKGIDFFVFLQGPGKKKYWTRVMGIFVLLSLIFPEK